MEENKVPKHGNALLLHNMKIIYFLKYLSNPHPAEGATPKQKEQSKRMLFGNFSHLVMSAKSGIYQTRKVV